MNLIALLIGLVIKRLATQLFRWRRMRWLDRIIDFGFRQWRPRQLAFYRPGCPDRRGAGAAGVCGDLDPR